MELYFLKPGYCWIEKFEREILDPLTILKLLQNKNEKIVIFVTTCYFGIKEQKWVDHIDLNEQ